VVGLHDQRLGVLPEEVEVAGLDERVAVGVGDEGELDRALEGEPFGTRRNTPSRSNAVFSATNASSSTLAYFAK